MSNDEPPENNSQEVLKVQELGLWAEMNKYWKRYGSVRWWLVWFAALSFATKLAFSKYSALNDEVAFQIAAGLAVATLQFALKRPGSRLGLFWAVAIGIVLAWLATHFVPTSSVFAFPGALWLDRINCYGGWLIAGTAVASTLLVAQRRRAEAPNLSSKQTTSGPEPVNEIETPRLVNLVSGAGLDFLLPSLAC